MGTWAEQKRRSDGSPRDQLGLDWREQYIDGKVQQNGSLINPDQRLVCQCACFILPGAPDTATRIACDIILGHSSGATTL
jgi:hypothetical protein